MFILFVMVWCATFIIPLACSGGGGGDDLESVRFPMSVSEEGAIYLIGNTIEHVKDAQRSYCPYKRGKGNSGWEKLCSIDFSKDIDETIVVEDQLPTEMWKQSCYY
jgi:hypothetical protein